MSWWRLQRAVTQSCAHTHSFQPGLLEAAGRTVKVFPWLPFAQESMIIIPTGPHHPCWYLSAFHPCLQTQSTMQACARHPSHPLLHFEPSPSQDLKMQVTSNLFNLCTFPDSQGKWCISNSPCSALCLWPHLPPIFPFLVHLCLLTCAVSFCTLACLVA